MTSAISGMSSGTGMVRPPMFNGARPDPAKMADQAFSKLDTGEKGYIDKADLQSAIDQLAGGQSGGSSATGTPSADDIMKSLDNNGDGKITKQEFSDGMKKLVDQMESQFNAARTSYQSGSSAVNQGPPSLDQAFSQLDTGAKGYLDKTDLQNAANQVAGNQASGTNGAPSVDDMMKALDTNGDGKITKQEFADGMQKVSQQSGPPPGMQGNPPGGMAGANASGGAQGSSSAQLVSQTASSSKTYDPADTNKDGTVTEQELIAYHNTSAYINTHPNPDAKKQDGVSNDQSSKLTQKIMHMLQAYMQNSSSFGTTQSNSISFTA